MRITDNLEEKEDKNLRSKTKGLLRSKWRPSGNITVSDDTLGKIGIDGVKDRVSGYTIRQIEDALINQRTWSSWKNNIKNKYNNATESNLDETFNYWDSQ